MGVGWPPALSLAWGGPAAIASASDGPKSGPLDPTYLPARPTPGDSATSRRSAGSPVTGDGPEQASTLPHAPTRSSATQPTPVTSHPSGSGQGHHSGTPSPRVTSATAAARTSRSTREGTYSGCTGPHASHCQSPDDRSGGCTGAPHRGQLRVPSTPPIMPPSWHFR